MTMTSLNSCRRFFGQKVNIHAVIKYRNNNDNLPCREDRYQNQLIERIQFTKQIVSRICLIVFLLPTIMMTTADNTKNNDIQQQQKQRKIKRYQAYPPYCGDEIEMSTRKIPPLVVPTSTNNNNETNSNPSSASSVMNTKLVHVTTIMRHGARTPSSPKSCWDGYWDLPEGIWDCSLKSVMVTNPYNTTTSSNGGIAMIHKSYDALGHESQNYKNNLNGTCQDGQLIQRGYDQQIINGQYLRNAYVYNGTNEQQDQRMRLFDTSTLGQAGSGSSDSQTYPFSESHLHFRSDDDQRTLASGQVLLSSMFGPELNQYIQHQSSKSDTTTYRSHPIIALHTADRPLDILGGNKKKCSSTQYAEKQAEQSQEFQTFFHSKESIMTRQIIHNEILKKEPTKFDPTMNVGEHGLQDCIMTTICTDRTLPDVINDYKMNNTNDNNDGYTKLYGTNRFERLVNYLIENRTIIYRYQDSEFSKRDIAPVWAEIMEHMIPAIQKTESEQNIQHVKFALYSAHDSTLAPLMASLSPNLWNATNFPWYASMMIIEIHQILDDTSDQFPTGYAFRLVYNGNVLTWLVDGCPSFSHLCDTSVLTDRVMKFASRSNGGCGDWETISSTTDNSMQLWSKAEESALKHPTLFLSVSMLFSFILGSILTFVIMKCCMRRPRRRLRNESELVAGVERDSSAEFMMEEPDIVID